MSTSSEWVKGWSKSAFCKGTGFIVEGAVVSTRIHSVFLRNTADKSEQEDQLPTRFLAVVVKVDLACRRNFDSYGVELAPKSARSKANNKGTYLNQYDKLDATLVEKVNNEELITGVGGGSGKALPDGFHDAGVSKLHPKVPGNFEFWADMEKVQHLWKDLKAGDLIRVRTLGDSVFVDSIARQDAQSMPHFTGDPKLGMAWTDKIMNVADKKAAPEEEEDNGEWD